ncbi:MAG: thioredoxin domain-containing protein [Alphaproteobacteria bacterium]|nr:thioredoxin domain-containing protein [Alphaproteobacteria bacterium]
MIDTRRRVLIGATSMLATLPLARASEPETAAHIAAPLLGHFTAPKRLVVWGSCTCPFTAQLFGVLRRIVIEMPKTVSVEWRHFPTHAPDPALGVAALGFEGERFWGFMFRVLTEVYNAKGEFGTLNEAKLIEFAKAEGGTQATLKAAYADQAKWRSVKEDLLAGQLLGITRTPAMFHNGYFMTPQGLPQDLPAFDKSLRTMLKPA